MKKKHTSVFTINLSIVFLCSITAALCALALFGCEQPTGAEGGPLVSPESQAQAVFEVVPGDRSLTVRWKNASVTGVLAGTGDTPDSSAGTVTINADDSAVITDLENNTEYHVWIVGPAPASENRQITSEHVTPIHTSVPSGMFASSSFIYALNGGTYTKYNNNGYNAPSGTVYAGRVVFADANGAIIIKTTQDSAGFSGALHAVKVAYGSDQLYKVTEATETPTIPDSKTGDITTAWSSDEDTANIVVGKLVMFDKNGGDTDAHPAAITVDAGKTAGTLPAPPTKANFQFSGWKTADGRPWTADTVVNANITVYAQWWTAEGGTKTFANMDDMTYFLANFYGETSAENPLEIVLTEAVLMDDLKTDNDSLGKIFDALDGKYVTLDMSAVPGTEIADAATTVTTIRANKDKLVSVTLPDTLEKIGNYAFADCASLESVTFPNTLTDVGQGAFLNCAVLATAVMPPGVTAILDSTFEGCASLDVDPFFFDNIEQIGVSAFKGSGITSFIPQKIARLGKSAFENCTKLETVDISGEGGPSSISESLFAGCSKLNSIILPSTGPSRIGAQAFFGCSELVSITLPTTLGTTRGKGAIDSLAFGNCTKLETVTWTAASSVDPAFGSAAFEGCVSLKTFTVPEGVKIIISAVTKKENAPFYGCINLTSITLPSTITGPIPANLFVDCENLTKITILKSSAVITLSNVNAFAGTPFEKAGNEAAIYVPDADTVTAYQNAAKWKEPPPISNYVSVNPDSL